MINNYIKIKSNIVRTVILAISLAVAGKAQLTQTFVFTGSVQTFTVPACVSTITMELWGAQGALAPIGGTPGNGGYVSAVVSVTPGQVYSIYVGGQNGYNGGALGGVNGNSVSSGPTSGNAGNGGGASDVRFGGVALTNRILVAGGGGGAGNNGTWTGCQTAGPAGDGGAGGNLVGGTGGFGVGNPCNCGGGGGSGGFGGSQSTGGATGSYTNSTACLRSSWTAGNPGTLGFGGAGATSFHNGSGGGGGGGGGYYGGGSGANGSDTTPGGGGGGGSSFVGTATNTMLVAGTKTGNGLVVFSYFLLGAIPNPVASPSAVCGSQSATLSASGQLSYTWSPGGASTSSIVVAPGTTTSYTVAGTNSVGCVSTGVITLTVNSSTPVLSITQTTTQICPTNTVMLTASGALLYIWSGGITNGIPFSPLSTAQYTVIGANGCGTASAVTGVTVSALPVAAIVQPTLICASQPATLNAAGAVNYSWQPGVQTGPTIVVNPTTTTIYTVVGTNSICAGINTVVLMVNPNPTITTPFTTTTICEDDAVTLSANGGLSYTWQPGGTGQNITVTPNTSTAYMVTGENQFGCTATANQVVIVNAKPILQINTNKGSLCPGNSATLMVSGTNSYLWLPSGTGTSIVVSPTISTTYTAIGTNTSSQCSASKTIAINVFTVNLTVSPNASICPGNTIFITASGANSYTWDTGANTAGINIAPTTSTNHIVSATTISLGMNCLSTKNIQVTVFPAPVVTAIANKTTMCRQETATLTADGALTYTWSTFLTTPTIVFKPTANITYTLIVTGTDGNGCTNTASASIKVNACTNIIEKSIDNAMRVFPNPNSGSFNILLKYEPKNTTVAIYNVNGQLIKSFSALKTLLTVELENEVAGIYFVELIENDISSGRIKIVKE